MDTSEFVRIDIEHLTGQLVIELNLHLKISELEIEARGKELTWGAKGVRITIPTHAAEALAAIIPPHARRAEGPSRQATSSSEPSR